jgi:hypothetical protein
MQYEPGEFSDSGGTVAQANPDGQGTKSRKSPIPPHPQVQ